MCVRVLAVSCISTVTVTPQSLTSYLFFVVHLMHEKSRRLLAYEDSK